MRTDEIENEGRLSVRTDRGSVYVNSSTPEDILAAQRLIERVSSGVNELIRGKSEDEMKSLQFRYELGCFLRDTLTRENIPVAVRKIFWQEINTVIDPENRIPKPAGESSSDTKKARHPFFETCYLIASAFPASSVEKFTWRQFNSLLDRPVVLRHPAVIFWLEENIEKITDNQLREILKILSAYGTEHDLDCFEDDALTAKMDLFYIIAKTWEVCFNQYFDGNEKNLSAARRKQKTKYKGKYIEDCLSETKFKPDDQWEPICSAVFVRHYVDVGAFPPAPKGV